MRHLLDVLRKDFDDTGNASTCGAAEAAETDVLHKCLSSLTPGRSRQSHTKGQGGDLFPYASLSTNCDSPTSAVSPSIPLHCGSPEQADSAEDAQWTLDQFQPEVTVAGWLNDHGDACTGVNDEDLHPQAESSVNDTTDLSQEQHESTASTSGEGLHLDSLEDGCDGPCKEIEDLGRRLSESLHVTQSSNQGSPDEQHRCFSVSDDEF